MSLLSGIWQGKLPVTKDSLTIVLFVENRGDSVYAVLDSPDQYKTDMAMDSYSFVNDTLRFTVKSLSVDFVGRMEKGEIKGRFTQYGRRSKLTLRPASERKLFPRPDEPVPPFPYQSLDLNFPYDTALPPINGTLTFPSDRRPKAALILISGSGRQDRNEEVCAHKPFLVIADFLTRAGYAVFRYDDPPYATFAKQTSYDFARQAQVVFDTLSSRKELASAPIGLVGHSEGGLIAWMVAAENPRVACVVSLAGMGVHISDILLYQTQALSRQLQISDYQIESNNYVNKSIYDIVKKSKSVAQADKKLQNFFDGYVKKMTPEQRKEFHYTDFEIAMMKQQVLSPWFYTLFHIKPADFMQKVRCPVLALNGSLDMQVSADENLTAMKASLKNTPSVTCQTLPGLNHLFQECKTGAVSEYGDIEQTIAPSALKAIETWLNERFE